MPITTYSHKTEYYVVPKLEFLSAVQTKLQMSYIQIMDMSEATPWHALDSVPDLIDVQTEQLVQLYAKVVEYKYTTGLHLKKWDNFLVAALMKHPVRSFVIR